MRKGKEKAGIVLIAALIIALLFSTAEAVTGAISAKVTIKNGELRLIPSQGEETVYRNEEMDLQLTPQTIMKSSAEICIVKIGEALFILDDNDSLAYESEKGSTFRCVGGSIEAISGDKTRKLIQGEVVALNSFSEGDESSNTANRARAAGERFAGPSAIQPPKGFPDDNSRPYQCGPYNSRWPWLSWYAGGQTPWVNASPYW